MPGKFHHQFEKLPLGKPIGQDQEIPLPEKPSPPEEDRPSEDDLQELNQLDEPGAKKYKGLSRKEVAKRSGKLLRHLESPPLFKEKK